MDRRVNLLMNAVIVPTFIIFIDLRYVVCSLCQGVDLIISTFATTSKHKTLNTRCLLLFNQRDALTCPEDTTSS